MKDIFDDISLSVIHFLENHEGVSNVQFFEIGPIASTDVLSQWQTKHAPYELPADFKSFLFLSDGLLLKWSIFLGNTNNTDEHALPTQVPLGVMHINSLADVLPVVDDEFLAFTLDSGMSANDGRAALVYDTSKTNAKHDRFQTKNNPQVWYLDLACEWHYIAKNFTEYFRLMVMHLGLPHWQNVFTSTGLDPISLHWFRFLSPERLAIDMQQEKEEPKKKPMIKLNMKKVVQSVKETKRK